MVKPKPILYPPVNLPQEIILEILSRLPLKSVGKSRCVSKGWNSLLTGQQFIKAHLTRNTPFLPEKLLLLGPRSLFVVTTVDSVDSAVLDGVLVKFDQDLIKCGGSCNGLVLVVGDKNTKFLINPITKQISKLPDSPLALSPYSSYCMHGFGYDTFSDDYKIVTLSYFDPEGYNTVINDTFIDVYSLKSNSWRRIGVSPYCHYSVSFREATASGVLLNGALHWVAWRYGLSFIASFSLTCENFEEIRAPASLYKETLKCCKLMVIRGCLGIVDDLSNEDMVRLSYDTVNVFIMKVYGSVDSWTKMVVNLEHADWKKVICFWRDVLFLSVDDDMLCEQHFVGYFFKDRDWGYLKVRCDEDGQFDDGLTFSESLVSPHFNGTR